MGPALVSDFPEIIQSIRLWYPDLMVRDWNNQYTEETIFFTDNNFFDFFSFRLIDGHPEKALNEPNTIVITQEMAVKYFNEINPIGKSLILQ